MTKKQQTLFVVEQLKILFPDAICALDYAAPHELLIAARLSAQCTDARVNMVTGTLFSRYPSIEAFASADVADIAAIIKSCGLYQTKARHIVAMCRMLLHDFAGQLPSTLEELTTLPGIGRKTANLMMGDVFHQPAVVTDTHFIRICNRLGLVDTKDPKKVEMAMKKLLPPKESSDFCHRIVLFGRAVCSARAPKCGECPLSIHCPSRGG